MSVSRMEVNAAISHLLGGTTTWKTHAEVVIKGCEKFLQNKTVGFEVSMTRTSGTSSITGHTSEFGDVNLGEDPKVKRSEYTAGMFHERIGHFKVRKESPGHIVIKHWWKADISTQASDEDTSVEYHLGYDPQTSQPTYFAVEGKRHVFNFFKLEIWRRYLEVIYGELKKVNRGWWFNLDLSR